MTRDGQDPDKTEPPGASPPPAETTAGESSETDAETTAAQASGPGMSPTDPDPIGELREKITAATEGFLKARLGLESGPDGGLQLPDRGVFENVGQRADQFLRGFLKGVIERTPEEREADQGLRDKADVPSATEVVGRMLSKASGAVSTSFHQYLQDHVATDDKPVVVDGRFLLQHGAPLLAGFVQALGQQFAEKADGEASDTPATEPGPDDTSTPKVDYKVDLPSLFTSLFVRPKDNDGGGQ